MKKKESSARARNAPPFACIFPMSNERRFASCTNISDQCDRPLRRQTPCKARANTRDTRPKNPSHPRTQHPSAGHVGWPPVRADGRCGSVTREYGLSGEAVASARRQPSSLPEAARAKEKQKSDQVRLPGVPRLQRRRSCLALARSRRKRPRQSRGTPGSRTWSGFWVFL